MIKRFLLKSYLVYKKYFIVQRGKFFISNTLDKFIGDVCIKANNGYHVYLKANSLMDLSYIEQNMSHKAIITILDELKEGDVFVDVGANVGYFTFYAAGKVGNPGRVFAFEPSDREYVRLVKGIHKNNLPNVISYHLAIADYSGLTEFNIDPFHTGLNSLSYSSQGNVGKNNTLIKPCDTLDHVFVNGHIDILKIDVEGAEYLVLQGAHNLIREKRIRKLIIEITPDYLSNYGAGKPELYKLLMDAGYVPLISSDEDQYDEVFILKNDK